MGGALAGYGLGLLLGMDIFSEGYGAASIAGIALVGLGRAAWACTMARRWRAARRTERAEERQSMAFVEPVTLRQGGLRLEPLALAHEDGLRAAAADGRAVAAARHQRARAARTPAPTSRRRCTCAHEGTRFAFAVIDEASGRVLGTSSYHDILPAVQPRGDRLHLVRHERAAQPRQHHLPSCC